MATTLDSIALANADDAKMEFIGKFVDAKHDIVSFVDTCLEWNEAGEFLESILQRLVQS